MTRYHFKSDGREIPFTAQEEAQADLLEQQSNSQEAKNEREDERVQENRLNGYLSVANVTDQLDAIWKILDKVVAENNIQLNASELRILNGLKQVKIDNPKRVGDVKS